MESTHVILHPVGWLQALSFKEVVDHPADSKTHWSVTYSRKITLSQFLCAYYNVQNNIWVGGNSP
jgi:hypothetical protein